MKVSYLWPQHGCSVFLSIFSWGVSSLLIVELHSFVCHLLGKWSWQGSAYFSLSEASALFRLLRFDHVISSSHSSIEYFSVFILHGIPISRTLSEGLVMV